VRALQLTVHAEVLRPTTGAGVRIAIVDSGVARGHPHVTGVALGIALVGDDPLDTGDRVGHGTAVTAAIAGTAPDAILMPIRVLDRHLATSARILAAAIDWAAEARVHLVNLSLGTTNPEHAERFALAVERARARGVLVVAAHSQDGIRCLPGALRGVVGVVADAAMPRHAVRLSTGDAPPADGPALAASPYPRPIPGVPRERNLSGVSFAVANATGVLARALEAGAPTGNAAALLAWLRTHAIPAGEGSR
jgi:subtilisin family serine protease